MLDKSAPIVRRERDATEMDREVESPGRTPHKDQIVFGFFKEATAQASAIGAISTSFLEIIERNVPITCAFPTPIAVSSTVWCRSFWAKKSSRAVADSAHR